LKYSYNVKGVNLDVVCLDTFH